MRRLIACLLPPFLLLTAVALPRQGARDGAKTEVKDAAAKARLLGDHRLSLQWISWDYFGKASVTERNGTLFIKGEQKSRKGDDSLTIDGMITSVEATQFRFRGTIITRVSHINGGAPCRREGEMTFAIKGARRYWRLKEMDNPCDGVTDYVDVYFR
ncbi:MAG TPA: hypothetical protein VFD58_35075 [Blastocatellia bacterium]|nr:hypothetical protein [Blastocatellia bacterium]